MRAGTLRAAPARTTRTAAAAAACARRTRRRTTAPAPSIFQSKDDPEIRFGFQYKVILKNDEEAAERPISLLGFLF
jgi:hypothetical protein